MKGFINGRALLAGLCGLTLAGLSGCYGYHDLVDPCYPVRYEVMSRHELNDAFVPQINNGHVLDQTVWNFYFEPGTDRLTAGGLEKLSYLARRRPTPDCTIWLQTAEDVIYDPAVPNRLVETRVELDNHRREAILKYLSAETAGRAVAFQVIVHDPADAGFMADPLGRSAAAMHGRFGGGATGGGAAASGGGASGAGSQATSGTPH
jgi:hypothetical protein